MPQALQHINQPHCINKILSQNGPRSWSMACQASTKHGQQTVHELRCGKKCLLRSPSPPMPHQLFTEWEVSCIVCLGWSCPLLRHYEPFLQNPHFLEWHSYPGLYITCQQDVSMVHPPSVARTASPVEGKQVKIMTKVSWGEGGGITSHKYRHTWIFITCLHIHCNDCKFEDWSHIHFSVPL